MKANWKLEAPQDLRDSSNWKTVAPQEGQNFKALTHKKILSSVDCLSKEESQKLMIIQIFGVKLLNDSYSPILGKT
mgnify:CR=1 FL=1